MSASVSSVLPTDAKAPAAMDVSRFLLSERSVRDVKPVGGGGGKVRS